MKSQQGAVLVTGLIILVVMTLLVLGLVRTAILQLKIGGANQVYVSNFETAQTAVDQYIAAYSGSRRFSKDCDRQSGDPAQNQQSCQPIASSFSIQQANVQFFPITNNIALNIVQTHCLTSDPNSGYAANQGPVSVYYNVNAQTSSAFFGGRARLEQGIRAANAQGACDTL